MLFGVSIVGTGATGPADDDILRVVSNDELSQMLKVNGKEAQQFLYTDEFERWWKQNHNDETTLAGQVWEKARTKLGHEPDIYFGTDKDIVFGLFKEESETSDEWIFGKTGIRSRFFVRDGVATSDLAVRAIHKALKKAGLQPDDVDAVLVATVTPDHFTTPPTVNLVCNKLGIGPTWPNGSIRDVTVMDGTLACCSFIAQLEYAYSLIESGRRKCVVVVGTDVMSLSNSKYSRNIYPILADGAGAFVLVRTDFVPERRSTFFGMNDGSRAGLIVNKFGGSAYPVDAEVVSNPYDQRHLMYMAGPTVKRYIVERLLPSPRDDDPNNLTKYFIPAALASFGFPMEGYHHLTIALAKFDAGVLHQANARIIVPVEERMMTLGFKGMFVDIIETYANTTSASNPQAIDVGLEQGVLKRESRIMVVDFGGGTNFRFGNIFLG